MGAPDEFTNRMFRSSSNEIDLVKKEEFLRYFGYEESFLEEWLLSRCGDLDGQESADFVDVSADRIIRGNNDYYPSNLSKGYVNYIFNKAEQVEKCKEKELFENQKSILKK